MIQYFVSCWVFSGTPLALTFATSSPEFSAGKSRLPCAGPGTGDEGRGSCSWAELTRF